MLEKNEENVCNIYANNKRQRCTSICKIHLSLYRYKTHSINVGTSSQLLFSAHKILLQLLDLFSKCLQQLEPHLYFTILWFCIGSLTQHHLNSPSCGQPHSLNGGALCITSLSYSIPSTQLSITVEPVYTHHSNPTPDSTNMHFNISATRL